MESNKFTFPLWIAQIVFFFFIFENRPTFAFESGKELFIKNCSVCHLGGNNVIIPEKNLKKNSLEENGMDSISAISYQILNGKNGMPAFGGRLNETEIETIAKYVFEQSRNNFAE